MSWQLQKKVVGVASGHIHRDLKEPTRRLCIAARVVGGGGDGNVSMPKLAQGIRSAAARDLKPFCDGKMQTHMR